MNIDFISAWLPDMNVLLVKAKYFGDKFILFLKWVALYLALVGVVSFSCFIMEESIQLLSFAQFSASDTRQYSLMKDNLDMMAEITDSLDFTNKFFLWLLPPQRMGYDYYVKATRQYIKTLEGEILANNPSVYIGRHVDIKFRHKSFKPAKNGLYIAQNNKVKAILTSQPNTQEITISGVIQPDPDKLGGVIIIAN